MKEKTKRILLVVFAIIFFAASFYIIYNEYKMNREEKRIEELQQSIERNPVSVGIINEQPEMQEEVLENEETEVQEPVILLQYEDLYQKNQDLIGWIKIDDTPIDYPVMQTSGETAEENMFYINHDFDKNESKQGLPLIDVRCTLDSENIIIYAHRMKNGTMFGSLKLYQEKSYYDEHQIIKFDTLYEESEYQIIAVLLAQVFYDEEPSKDEFVFYDYVEMDSEELFQEYVNQVKQRSLYDTGVTAEYGDKLITLCTCNYHVKDGRLLVVAKKI